MVSKKDLIDWFGKPRGYAHLDEAAGSAARAARVLSDPEKVKRHGFFPFIQFESKQRRVLTPDHWKSPKIAEMKAKCRPLAYCSHIDRYIYSYYSKYLNEKYNDWTALHDLDDCVVAYRSSDNSPKFLHKNNITYAKAAFEFINRNKPCRVVVSDFEGYFDNIDHCYLKNRLCDLLNVEQLDDDLYAVYKNVTKYSIINKNDIDKFIFENEGVLIRKAENSPLLTKEQFAEFRETGGIHRHKDLYGIPQGSPISAVLSNIYLMEFDLALKQFADQCNGFYIRYCDDLILIAPDADGAPTYTEIHEFLNSWTSGSKIQHLKCSSNKTKYFYFSNAGCAELDRKTEKPKYSAKSGKNRLDYLGFVFDGKTVQLRPKSVLKYYYRAYKKIQNSANQENGGRHNIYAIYSDKIYRNTNLIPRGGKRSVDRYIRLDQYAQNRVPGRRLYNFKVVTTVGVAKKIELQGNYITYIKRVRKTFENSELIFVERILKRHLTKLGNRFRKCNMVV